MRRQQWITVAVSLAAASLLAIGVQATTWWTDGQTSVRPIATEACFAETCRRSSLAWAGSNTWARSGTATYAGGLIAAAALVALAGAGAAGRAGRALALAVASAAVTSFLASIVFVMSRPGTVEPFRLGSGPLVFVGGIVAAMIAAGLVLRRRQAVSS